MNFFFFFAFGLFNTYVLDVFSHVSLHFFNIFFCGYFVHPMCLFFASIDGLGLLRLNFISFNPFSYVIVKRKLSENSTLSGLPSNTRFNGFFKRYSSFSRVSKQHPSHLVFFQAQCIDFFICPFVAASSFFHHLFFIY